jgi:NADH dehydrogenase
MKNPNVTLAFGGHITKVDEKNVYTDDGKVIPSEIFIWTGGVEGNNIAKKSELPVNKRGQIPVNNYLQMENHPEILVAGDLAGYTDPKTNELVPNVAQVAEDQGATAAENVIRLISNKTLEEYKYRHFGYVVPLRGRYAVAELMWGIHLDGILGWMLQQIVFLRYLLGILPLPLALRRWNDFEMHLEQ